MPTAVPMVDTEPLPAVYARLANRPGALAHAADALARRRLNVKSLGVETLDGLAFARLLVTPVEDAIAALREAGVEAYASELVAAKLPNRPGQLARAAAELAAAGVNVEAALATPDRRLAFRTSDNALAAAILGKL